MKAKIITDSMSDLTVETAKTYDIDVLPISFSLDGSAVSEYDLDVSETVKWIEENKKIPTFKGVSTETYANTFEKYVKQGREIICITSGSKSISNYDCACHASTRFPNANIHVIDSHHVSGNTAMMAINAAIMANDGESANAIAIKYERSMDKFKNYGFAYSVKFLQYAGMCPKIIAVGSNLINAKYEFEMLEDRKFNVQLVGNSIERAISNYCTNIFKDLHSINPQAVFLLHTVSDEDYLADVYKRVMALNYFEEIIVVKGGHYTTSIVGKNGLGIAYQKK